MVTMNKPKTQSGGSLKPVDSAWTSTTMELPPELTIVDVQWGGRLSQAVRCGLQWNHHPRGHIVRPPDSWKMPNAPAQRPTT